MDFLLLEPPYKSLKGVGAECGYTMSLTCLAAYLRRHGFDAGVVTGDTLLDLPPSSAATLDMEAYAEGQASYERILDDRSHEIWERIRRIVEQERPRAVGLSYLTPMEGTFRRTAAAVKEADPDVVVVAGGHHPTFCPEATVRLPEVDLAVRGEGELPLLGVARAIRDGSRRWESVPGLSFLCASGEVRSTPMPGLLPDLDALPEPARDLVLYCDYEKFRTHYAVSARGCPYRCAFCSDRELWRHGVRRRSVESFVAELARLRAQYDPAFVDIVDGTFTFDRRFLSAFCRRMADERVGLSWRCTARYDNVDEEILRLAAEAGCAALYFGLESGSSRTLERVRKGMTVEEIERRARMVRDHGIVAITAVLLGTPGETADDLRDTLRLMREVDADIFDVNVYVPLPGTPLYERMPPAERDAIDWRTTGYKAIGRSFSGIPDAEFRALQREAYAIAAETLRRFLARTGRA